MAAGDRHGEHLGHLVEAGLATSAALSAPGKVDSTSRTSEPRTSVTPALYHARRGV